MNRLTEWSAAWIVVARFDDEPLYLRLSWNALRVLVVFDTQDSLVMEISLRSAHALRRRRRSVSRLRFRSDGAATSISPPWLSTMRSRSAGERCVTVTLRTDRAFEDARDVLGAIPGPRSLTVR